MQGLMHALSNLNGSKLYICCYYCYYSKTGYVTFFLTLKRIVFINRLTYMHSYQQYVKYLLRLRKCAEGYHRNMSDRNSGQLPLLAQRSVVEYKVFEVLENMHKSKDDQYNRIKISMHLSAFLKWDKCPRKF